MSHTSLNLIDHHLGFFGKRAVRKYLPDMKVNAIKALRKRVPFVGLKEAKEWVDLQEV